MSNKPRQSVQLEDETYAILSRVSEATGLSKMELVRRLFRWLGDQPDVIQAEVLGTLPPSIRRQAAEWIVQEMAGKTPASAPEAATPPKPYPKGGGTSRKNAR